MKVSSVLKENVGLSHEQIALVQKRVRFDLNKDPYSVTPEEFAQLFNAIKEWF